ncbi:hypothetical protein [Lysobacter silvisoli]|uniref:Secreted protein n=1 Tax=Lysobacter silvisoli TaxID=2293254 RepID=A0A371K589_9GAMM|nr:hypothetical protein [Lysobacter silvisoli]RDZ29099.1 hypothetical protein DX914_08380 [Lysobacter silvisoli]
MNTTSRLMLIACLALPFVAACKKEEAAPAAAVQAPLTAPKSSDDNEWSKYLTDVVKRKVEADGIATSPYLYYLPAESTADFQGYYDRQLEKAKLDVARGISEGSLLAYGSPASAKIADLIVAAFPAPTKETPPMKNVKVMFIGAAADSERVKAAVTPYGVEYSFVEAK